jgi:hypothetical protein
MYGDIKNLTNFETINVRFNQCDKFVIQNYWVFGLFPSSGILGNRGHNVSEIGSVSVFR